MLIKSIFITKLFGMFDYRLEFNYNNKITILYGPNGIGKTAILNLINNIFQKEFRKVSLIKFDKIKFDLDNNSSFEIIRNCPKYEDEEIYQLNFFFKSTNKSKPIKMELPEYYYIENDRERFFISKRNFLRCAYENDEISRSEYRNSLDELYMMRRYPISRRMYIESNSNYMKSLEKFDSLFEKFRVRTKLIGTRRLVKEGKRDDSGGNTLTNTVEKYSKDLAEKITKVLKQYSSIAQEKEKSFPFRIIDQNETENKNLKYQQIDSELQKLEQKRTEYENLGILDKNENDKTIKLNRQNSTPTKLGVLNEYILDNKEKFKVLEELITKITLFKTVINKRFSNKEIFFNSEEGFYFINCKGDKIDINNLSSGEQHEIVMFYDFLFTIDDNTLIIIDEPELSLHVAWQVEFLKDYMHITENKKNHLLIATHSPQLINDYWDLCIDLEENCEYST